MPNVLIEIRSVRANHAILHSILEKQSDKDGRTTFNFGDTKAIDDEVSIRYEQRRVFEAQEIAEPILFTVLVGLSTGIAGSVIGNYLSKKLEPFASQIKELFIGGKKVTLSKEEIEKAFQEALDEAERRDRKS